MLWFWGKVGFCWMMKLVWPPFWPTFWQDVAQVKSLQEVTLDVSLEVEEKAHTSFAKETQKDATTIEVKIQGNGVNGCP